MKLQIKDILYLEAMKDYTRIKTTTRQYLVLTTLKDILNKLPQPTFIQVHRSYIINTEKITAMEKGQISIHSDTIPIGKIYRAALNGIFT